MTCVSMGNPHVRHVLSMQPSDHWVLAAGPRAASRSISQAGQRRISCKSIARRSAMRVWDAAAAKPWPAAPGACAVCVAGVLTGRTERRILAHLPGGDLELEWAADNHVYLTGEAVEVFSGEWDWERGIRI